MRAKQSQQPPNHHPLSDQSLPPQLFSLFPRGRSFTRYHNILHSSRMGPRLSDHSDHSQPLGRKEQQNHRLDRWENTGEERTASESAASARQESGNSRPKCQSSVGGRRSKLKENIGPREKCEEARYTEQRRSDYPISIVGKQNTTIARRFDRYNPDQSI